MDFGLAISISGIKENLYKQLVELSDMLRLYFSNKDYGSSIKVFTVGIVVFEPVYANFFKEKIPKYYPNKSSITHDGITIEVENAFEFEIRIDHDKFIKSKNVKQLVASELLKSIKSLQLPKKIKDFDKEKFMLDMGALLKENNPNWRKSF